jgi:WhiB family transcriptional regulator, redox-sensing transcriptional regulator
MNDEHLIRVLGIVDGGEWRRAALCVRVDPEIFYPLDETPGSAAVAVAKRICAGCPVRKVCLTDVMAAEDPARRWGITGGMTPTERATRYARLRRLSARPAGVAA